MELQFLLHAAWPAGAQARASMRGFALKVEASDTGVDDAVRRRVARVRRVVNFMLRG